MTDTATSCEFVPPLLSSFINAFVDFSVTGNFLPDDPQATVSGLPPTRHPSADRLIAVGDLHGDLDKTHQAFRLAGLIDGRGKWSGGSTTVVQIGDVLDRGGEELKILYFLEKLKREAAKSGGQLITLNGNHEIMNVEGDFRYVTQNGLEEFSDWGFWYCLGNQMKSLCTGLENPVEDPFHGIPLSFNGIPQRFHNGIRARIAALRPSGPIARRFLADNLTVLVVGESVFVHGGLLKGHVEYGLERMNEEVRDWINGFTGRGSPSPPPPRYCRGRNSVVWLRKYSEEVAAKCDCALLDHALATIPGAKRMIMGHTIQSKGINEVCGSRAVRIDVGMSKGCSDGLPEVLEIVGDSQMRALVSYPNSKNNKLYNNAAAGGGGGGGGKQQGLGLLVQDYGPKQVKVGA